MLDFEKTNSKIRQCGVMVSGIRQVAGVNFFGDGHEWVTDIGPLKLILHQSPGTRCTAFDTRDGSKFPFQTVTGAVAFAKRRRHGRSLEEHQRAEIVQTTRERFGWGVKDIAERLGVSPRTIEAWSSGARAVPKMAIAALDGI